MQPEDCKIGTSVIYRGIIIHNISGFIIKSPYYPEYDKINLYVRIMTVCGNDIAVKINRLEKL